MKRQKIQHGQVVYNDMYDLARDHPQDLKFEETGLTPARTIILRQEDTKSQWPAIPNNHTKNEEGREALGHLSKRVVIREEDLRDGMGRTLHSLMKMNGQ